MELSECRKNLDRIDDEILKLFLERMETVSEVAKYKKEKDMPVFQSGREREIFAKIARNSGEEMENYSKILFSVLLDLSRSYQAASICDPGGEISSKIRAAMENTAAVFPKNAVVACQGVDGAYSQLACEKIFSSPSILYFKSFEGVFSAINKGLCRYGILPIENSIHGSVNQVYDLMKNYNFSIVRSIKLKVNHALLAKSGAKMEDITDIYSHEQAIGQCSQFLKRYPDIRVHICENTAVAAQLVANSKEAGAASISSPECAAHYGLDIICDAIADSDSNYTRFICISKELEIYPGADKISLMLRAEHRPGALHAVISRLATAGLNITKLESRPIAGSDFEYLFYFDIDVPACTDEVLFLLDELCSNNKNSVFLGSYSEI